MKLLKLTRSKRNIILTIFLFLMALLPRLYRLEESFAWDQEQGIAFWTIKKIVVEKKLPLVGQHFLSQDAPVFRPPFFAYFATIPLLLTQNNPLSIEFCLAVLGALTAIVVFIVSRRLFGTKAGIFAFLGYSFSNFVIKADKNLIPPTLLIFTSTAIIYLLLVLQKKTKNLKLYAALGLFVGLCFSFHFSAIIIFLSISLALFLNQKRVGLGVKKTLAFLFPFLLMLSPVLLFNLRHNFIMLEGFKKIIFGESFNTSLTTLERFILAVSTLNQLNTHLFFLKIKTNQIVLTFLLWLIPAIILIKLKKTHNQKIFFNYLLFLLVFSLVFLTLVANPFYQMTHLILFLIPFFFIFWGKILSYFWQDRLGKATVLLILSIFVFQNAKLILSPQKSSYSQKLALVNEILRNAKPNKITNVKFLDQDYTPYDFLIYYRAPFYSLKYENVNLIQPWMEEEGDVILREKNGKNSIIFKEKE